MKKSFILLFLTVYLIGCKSIQHDLNDSDFGIWKYSDVRLLDPVDTPDPERDLIALYTRVNSKFFQIRIDFLDLDSTVARDIYIPIDINPGGSDQIKTRNNGLLNVDIDWDYLIIYPGSGNVEIVNSNYFPIDDIELLISLNSIQDNIVLSFDKKEFPTITTLTKLQVLITQPNQDLVVDQTSPTFIDAYSPSRTKVLFAFWNTFASSTPAETLRSWAGAHSGPMSSRHGLKYVIDAAAKAKYSVFLFDLMKPETISALDYIGATKRIQNLENQEVLVLYNNNVNNKYEFGYIYDYYDNRIYKNFNIDGYDYAQFFLNNNICPLSPQYSADKASIIEISLRCKTQLISNGISGSIEPIIWGGDFQNSFLGDPVFLNYLISYINNHPWIQVLSVYNLPTNILKPAATHLPYYKDASSIQNNFLLNMKFESNSILSQTEKDVYSALLDSPKNQISLLAWQVYTSLSNPASSELIPLAGNYFGKIGYILAAAKWVDQPIPNTTCEIDLDYDGDPECILANSNIFVTIEPEGTYIPFIFTRDADGSHQIVGPTWEFIIGLSDPSTWDLSLGIRSDPGQILGAFVDNFDYWEKSKIYLSKNSIIFENEIMSMRKSFIITNTDIDVEFLDPHSLTKSSQIPLVLDPWIRYTTGWGDKYKNSRTSQSILWEIYSGISVELLSNNQISVYPFNATHAKMAYPEDPNFDYGRGHYLPYPMALAEIQSLGGYLVDIVVNP